MADNIRKPTRRRRPKPMPQKQAGALTHWLKLARTGDVQDECKRLTLNQPFNAALVVRVEVPKATREALEQIARTNTQVWNRAVVLAVNGLPRKSIIDRAMAARRDVVAMRYISSAVIYSTAWCASMMRKCIDTHRTESELEQLQIDPKRRAFLLVRQGCAIERSEIKFPGVGYLKIHQPDLFDRFYALDGRWTAIVLRGKRTYVVIDAPSPLELLRHERTDYEIRLQATRCASKRNKKDPLRRRQKSRDPILARMPVS